MSDACRGCPVTVGNRIDGRFEHYEGIDRVPCQRPMMASHAEHGKVIGCAAYGRLFPMIVLAEYLHAERCVS